MNPNEELRKLEQEIEEYQKNSQNNNFDINQALSEAGFDIDLDDFTLEDTEYINKIDLLYKKSSSDAVSPKYNYPTDSGFDLYSTEDVVIGPFGRALIPTGLSFDIKEGTEIQVRSKSGLALNQGLFVLNSPGTVDAGYTGEVKVIIFNTNNQSFTVKKGMKVAQAVVCPIIPPTWLNIQEVNEIKSKDRNTNGFGSTGI
jgi:dUTP pyrophosphatase